MNAAESRVVIQPIGDLIIVPVQGPVHEGLLRDLGEIVTDHLQREAVRGVILDMAGVEILDEDDFEGLRKVVDCTTLMGTPVIFAGIRPGVAAGITMLGVDDSWVRAVRTVAQAMALLR